MKKILFSIILINFFALATAENSGQELSPSQVVTKAYETFSAGDMKGWSALHSKDLTFTILGDLPQSGSHKGTQAPKQLLTLRKGIVPHQELSRKLLQLLTKVQGKGFPKDGKHLYAQFVAY